MRLYRGKLLDDQTPVARLRLLPPPEPVHDAESTTSWTRLQSAAWVTLLCCGAMALIAIAAWVGAR
jgi:hypothetical protein